MNRDDMVEKMLRKFAQQTITFSTWILNYMERRGIARGDLQETRDKIDELRAFVDGMR